GMKTIDELKREVAETRLPEEIKKMFYGVLDTADFASLTEEQQARYESDLKNYMDTMSCIRFARKEGASEGYTNGHADGKAEGLIQGKVETAKAMKADGVDYKFISKYTNIPVEEIEKL
ncbi:MAG: hypothetical protein IJ383_03955, partial [Bacteroidales bacterium]|nr:hypothetical protein [Bacteroidales bacterium]